MDIKIDAREFLLLQRKLKNIKGGLQLAIKRASTRAATKAAADIAKKITKASNIPSAVTKENVSKKPYGSSGMQISLAKSKRLGTRHFKPQQDEIGVSWVVNKGGKRLQLAGAFMGPTPNIRKVSWKQNAFIRSGKNRLPINKVVTVSPWGFFTKNRMVGPSVAEISKYFRQRVQHEVRFLISKNSSGQSSPSRAPRPAVGPPRRR